MSKKIGKNLTRLLADMEDARVSAPPAEVVDGENIYNIDIAKVTPNPNQPRRYFGIKELKELEDSIKANGIIQPLILTKKGDMFLIVAGERRYRAAKNLGLSTVPAIVKKLDERQIREISLIENLQREDLNAIEEAMALKELSEMYDLTQEDIARRIGKSRSSIANTMRLLSLTDEVKSLVSQNKLSAGHARTLIPITDKDAQIDFAYQTIDAELSVRELEIKVRDYLNPPAKAVKPAADRDKKILSLELRSFVDGMKRIFATKVMITGNDNKGRIYIDYYNRDDLQRIYELMEKLKKND